MKQVLVTGANGLLGRNLCQHLVVQGMDVVGIVRKHSKPLESPNPGLIELDFSSNWPEDELPAKIDTIIHLAQSSKFRDFPDNALDVFKVNIESTARLLDYAKRSGVKQFIYASSGGVYGNSPQAFRENSPIPPPSQLGYYLGSKTCGEILVQSYASIFQVVVLRPFFMYGPNQNRNMLIPRLMDNISAGNPVSLQGEHGIRVNPVHVDDASKAVAACLKLNESATFNIAGPEVLSIRQISEGMAQYLGVSALFKQQEESGSDLIADISAMQEKLVSPERKLFDCFKDISK